MTYTKGQEFAAEFFGTMVLVLFGCGSVAMVVLFASNPPIPGQVVNGGYTNIVLGWGLAVTFGIYVSGTISGAHLNPAVTIALAATRRFPWSKTPHYIVAQFAGAFAAAAFFRGLLLQMDRIRSWPGPYDEGVLDVSGRAGFLAGISTRLSAPRCWWASFSRSAISSTSIRHRTSPRS